MEWSQRNHCYQEEAGAQIRPKARLASADVFRDDADVEPEPGRCPLPSRSPMTFLRRYRYFLAFTVLLLGGSVMAVRQVLLNQSRHVELREAFILLHAKGYTNETQRLFQRLLSQLEDLPDTVVMADYQRTLTLVDPAKADQANLVWRYHWTVSNELEKRSEGTLARALKLAHEP